MCCVVAVLTLVLVVVVSFVVCFFCLLSGAGVVVYGVSLGVAAFSM